MDIETTRFALLWCTVINCGILLVWFLFFALGNGVVERLHGRWFRLSREQFHAIHYAAMAVYKLGILLLNLVPCIVLYVVA